MKKVLFAIVAVASLAACNNEQTISRSESTAIKFDYAFVENSTRANDITASNLENFSVFGSVTGASEVGKIFDNQLVEGDATNGYTYSPLQYWVGNAQYAFAAFAPATEYSAHWTYTTADAQNGTLEFSNVDAEANQDLVYAYAERTIGDTVGTQENVKLTFNHLLSRVKFTFTNGFSEGNNITLKVYDVAIENVHKNGSLTIANGVDGDWSVEATTFERAFGEAGADYLAANVAGETTHYYLIPANATFNISFKVDIKQAGVYLDTYERTAEVALNMAKGNSYNVKATLNYENTSDEGALQPIVFEVEGVVTWENTSWNDANGVTTY